MEPTEERKDSTSSGGTAPAAAAATGGDAEAKAFELLLTELKNRHTHAVQQSERSQAMTNRWAMPLVAISTILFCSAAFGLISVMTLQSSFLLYLIFLGWLACSSSVGLKKEANLVAGGAVATGTIVQVRKRRLWRPRLTRPYLGRQWYVVDYHFTAEDGVTHHGRMEVPEHKFDQPTSGTQLIVLYDPTNPRSSIIYQYTVFEFVKRMFEFHPGVYPTRRAKIPMILENLGSSPIRRQPPPQEPDEPPPISGSTVG